MRPPYWMALLAIRLFVSNTVISAENSTQQLSPDRTQAFYSPELKCHVGYGSTGLASMSRFDFGYWYAMGTTSPIGQNDMYLLEQAIFSAIQNQLLWCWSEKNATYVASSLNHGGRKLGISAFSTGSADTQVPVPCPQTVDDKVRLYGAVACMVVRGTMRILASSNDDVSYAIAGVRDALQQAMSSGLGANGTVLPQVELLVYLGDDKIGQAIGTTGGELVGSEVLGNSIATKNPTEKPSVWPSRAPIAAPTRWPIKPPTEEPTMFPTPWPTRWPIKPPTEEPTLFPTPRPSKAPIAAPTRWPIKPPTEEPTLFPTPWPSRAPSRLPSTGPTGRPSNAHTVKPTGNGTATMGTSNVTETGNSTIVGAGHNETNSTGSGGGAIVIIQTNNNNNSIPLILGIGIPIAVGLIAAALFAGRGRRAVTSSAYRDMMKSDYVLIGTGDHPDSFHEGLYHYMPGGMRYLSTRCESCLETRRNSFYTDHNLGTIFEDEEYRHDAQYAARGRPYGERGLGAKFKTMDVHKCRSATCLRCNPITEQAEPTFVTTHYGEIREDPEMIERYYGEQVEV